MVLVVGTIGLDSIETPNGTKKECVGGSAMHFAYAASVFGPVRLVSVVGEDFPASALQELSRRGIDTAGVSVAPGKTFRWSCRYFDDMDRRETLSTELNVFAQWKPCIPPQWRDSSTVFLANLSPQLQLSVLDQLEKPRLVVADTMDLWIQTERQELEELLRRVHGFVLNEEEARLLTEEPTTIRAGRSLLERGLQFVIIKKGGHGATLFTEQGISTLPAYPVERVYDPTGAGDSFAGGLMGYLAGRDKVDLRELKRALALGTCIASFNVEDFGTERLARLSPEELEERLSAFRMMLSV